MYSTTETVHFIRVCSLFGLRVSVHEVRQLQSHVFFFAVKIAAHFASSLVAVPGSGSFQLDRTEPENYIYIYIYVCVCMYYVAHLNYGSFKCRDSCC